MITAFRFAQWSYDNHTLDPSFVQNSVPLVANDNVV